MAIHKVLGTETEYGITIRHQADFNPVLASSMVINSYAGGRARIQWSFEEETPGLCAAPEPAEPFSGPATPRLLVERRPAPLLRG